jgi:plasmid stability protein
MASITIRNLEEQLKARLRIQAATHGWSMEEEARDILSYAHNREPGPTTNLGSAIHARFRPFGGVDLPQIAREPVREPPVFDQ